MASKQTPRINYHKILYVTDLSEAGRAAFPHAAGLAQLHRAELTVFHVIEPREFEKYLVGYMSNDLWNQIKTRDLDDARRLLIERKRDDAAIRDSVEGFCQTCQDQDASGAPYVSYDVQVEHGDPVERIVDKAKCDGYDLVVIAKHGHGVIHGGLLGDTVRAVVRRCPVPVLVVPAPEDTEEEC